MPYVPHAFLVPCPFCHCALSSQFLVHVPAHTFVPVFITACLPAYPTLPATWKDLPALSVSLYLLSSLPHFLIPPLPLSCLDLSLVVFFGGHAAFLCLLLEGLSPFPFLLELRPQPALLNVSSLSPSLFSILLSHALLSITSPTFSLYAPTHPHHLPHPSLFFLLRHFAFLQHLVPFLFGFFMCMCHAWRTSRTLFCA